MPPNLPPPVLLFYLLLLLCSVILVQCASFSCYREGAFNLPRGYNPMAAPNYGSGNATEIYTMNIIFEIVEVDDVRRTFTVQMMQLLWWQDERLLADDESWPSWERNNINRSIAISEEFLRNCLWTPMVVIMQLYSKTAKDVREDTFANSIEPGGFVSRTGMIDYTVYCNMDLTWYPFDEHRCDFIEFVTNNREMSKLYGFRQVLNLQRSLKFDLEIVDLVDPGYQAMYEKHDTQVLPFAGWTLRLRRKVLPHMLETYFPSVMFVMLSWISFFIPPDIIPGRMTLLLTLILVQVSMLLRVSDAAPGVTNALVTWVAITLSMVVLAALEYAVILYIKYVHYGNASRIGAVQKNKSKMEEAHRLCLRIDRNSRIGFPAISIIKGIIYYFYCSYGVTMKQGFEPLAIQLDRALGATDPQNGFWEIMKKVR